MSHVADAQKALKTISGTRTNAVKASVALVHATLEVASAVRANTAELKRHRAVIERLWHEQD